MLVRDGGATARGGRRSCSTRVDGECAGASISCGSASASAALRAELGAAARPRRTGLAGAGRPARPRLRRVGDVWTISTTGAHAAPQRRPRRAAARAAARAPRQEVHSLDLVAAVDGTGVMRPAPIEPPAARRRRALRRCRAAPGRRWTPRPRTPTARASAGWRRRSPRPRRGATRPPPQRVRRRARLRPPRARARRRARRPRSRDWVARRARADQRHARDPRDAQADRRLRRRARRRARAGVRTGTFCVYEPDPRAPAALDGRAALTAPVPRCRTRPASPDCTTFIRSSRP